ncbi:MAG: sulfotransferase [Candidatus Thermoplasmatota archaeon]|jgi:hypothetical protein|nr:sulfotransferase [Candidatus Thermoplasmatota archaeon]
MKKITWKIVGILLEIYWPLQRVHNFFLSLVKDRSDTKIFCIGGPKTGTTSLHKALKILGYKSARMFDWPTYQKYGEEKYIEEIKKSSYDAFVDYPFGDKEFYKKIDLHFPESKFILTVRDTESLKKSYYNFYKNSQISERMLKNLSEKMKFLEKRNEEIINYFRDKPSRLLVMNITGGDGWEKLCNFLDKPIPNKLFPHKNKGNYREIDFK